LPATDAGGARADGAAGRKQAFLFEKRSKNFYPFSIGVAVERSKLNG
jgi:hypothetical protein